MNTLKKKFTFYYSNALVSFHPANIPCIKSFYKPGTHGWFQPIIFIVEADSITEADELFNKMKFLFAIKKSKDSFQIITLTTMNCIVSWSKNEE